MKLIILDRDGVINEDSDAYIKSPEEWVPIPGSLEAIARLNRAGWTVAVATNQSGVGRGLYDRATLDRIHARMNAALAAAGGRVDALYYCPHTPEDHCTCRKPLPGLLESIARHYGVSLAGVPAIGDSLRDLQAAVAVDARPILVRTGKGEQTLTNPDLPPGTPVYPDLAAAVTGLLNSEPAAEDHRENTAC
ncbi:D-glycero-beta-D-manno-heptose 1,7-bisphosphate 7-phosphatase [Thioalbus denitrificans]|uniref:D,D-heptose 1,7-bisphosphate phosphatase n=1 Tax=Thioalbus denitrificans TaxID=547122 RepID=A0A369CK68_9GAMM|nr:D-glycero-beta-D-manno-heptose 1,7-bisphosphate 7-phosphatase [Thioalbus denitrificans]RCX32837.1 D-alpha,beta-D-heptose 1,7-bisphosphate phosphatase [Thioalbus denitrificans]